MKLTNTYKILNEGTALGMELERQVEDGGRGAGKRGRRIKKTVFAFPLGTFSFPAGSWRWAGRHMWMWIHTPRHPLSIMSSHGQKGCDLSFQLISDDSQRHLDPLVSSAGGADGQPNFPQETRVPRDGLMAVYNTLIFILIVFSFSWVELFSRVRLCDPMDCSTPGLPVHHQLPEFTQTHVHWVGDAIQPSHPLLSPSPPALNFS